MAETGAASVPLETALAWLQAWRDRLCAALEEADGSQRFQPERWRREAGGGGESRLLEGGDVFEKLGVNYSHIWGEQLPDHRQ